MADQEFRLYNTLTRKIEPFTPEDGQTVRIYTCGPTVYRPAHLGNFRTFLFEDLLRRVIQLRGWKILQVMNLTDVDDKIIKSASEQGSTIAKITAPITEIFHKDRAFLRIQDAELYPKATEHIPEMIGIVQRLVERKLAYLADDGSVYFAIDKFKGYGKLSRLDTREVKAGARVIQDDYSKENAQDFAERLAAAKGATPELEKIADETDAEVTTALFDDLNAPIALGALFMFVRKANAELDRNGVDKRALERARAVFARINSVLDVVPVALGPDPELARWVEEKLSARKDARGRRDFAAADRIRAEIEGKGVTIEDTPQGTKWKKVR
jgi:cysteinyl-tRNA synthetase